MELVKVVFRRLSEALVEKGELKAGLTHCSLTPGTSVALRGVLGASRGKEQAVELQVDEVKVLGACDQDVSLKVSQADCRRILYRRKSCRLATCENMHIYDLEHRTPER